MRVGVAGTTLYCIKQLIQKLVKSLRNNPTSNIFVGLFKA